MRARSIFELLDPRAVEALVVARREAVESGCVLAGPIHLFVGVLVARAPPPSVLAPQYENLLKRSRAELRKIGSVGQVAESTLGEDVLTLLGELLAGRYPGEVGEVKIDDLFAALLDQATSRSVRRVLIEGGIDVQELALELRASGKPNVTVEEPGRI